MLNVRVSLRVELLAQVLDTDDAAVTADRVEVVESILGSFASDGMEGTSEIGHELGEVQSAVTVGVELLEKNGNVLLADANAEIASSLDELGQRQRLGAIVIHDGEETSQADHAAGASGLQLVAEQLEEGIGRVLSRRNVSGKLTLFFLDVRVFHVAGSL